MEINFNEVDFSYNKINYFSKKVLSNLSIVFKKNKIHGITGKSGCGKTTMIELINALILPTKGQIEVGDFTLNQDHKSIDIKQLRSQVGVVFQNPENQFFNLTVYDELAFGMRYYNYRVNEIDKRVRDSLKMVGLNDSYLSRNPFHLSNGEKRKIAIASILIFNPSVLILDEPSVGLDGGSKEGLLKLLRMLKNRYNKTILIVSHDTDFLHRIVDFVHVLYAQKIVLSGSKYDVFKEIKLLKKYGVKAPKIIEFSDKVLNKKNIRIGYRDEINDLIKDIYRYVK